MRNPKLSDYMDGNYKTNQRRRDPVMIMFAIAISIAFAMTVYMVMLSFKIGSCEKAVYQGGVQVDTVSNWGLGCRSHNHGSLYYKVRR